MRVSALSVFAFLVERFWMIWGWRFVWADGDGSLKASLVGRFGWLMRVVTDGHILYCTVLYARGSWS
ncbi:hypothetical protein V8C42DRAFT_317539 [Trichoderma barbatum]